MEPLPPLPRNRSLVVWRRHYVRPRYTKNARTICEVLRELYRDADARGDALAMTRLEEAHDMAKRMQDKLAVYAKKNNDPAYLIITANNDRLWMTKNQFKAYEKPRTAKEAAKAAKMRAA